MSLKIKYLYFYLVFFIILTTACSSSLNNKIIAKFDSGQIKVDEVLSEYKELSDEKKDELKSNDDYFRFIRKLALQKIILNNASELDYENDKDILLDLKKAEKNIGFDILKKKNVYDKIEITDIDYRPYRKVYELYHIVKRIDFHNEERNNQSINELMILADEIKTFDDFRKKAAEISDDITASNNGFVGKIRLGVMEKAIDEKLSKMKENEISDVITSSKGYHILYVKNIEISTINKLLQDKELNDMIYDNKFYELEEKWYQNLLNEKALLINKENIKKRKKTDEILIQYKNDIITCEYFFNRADEYKNDSFPEPTFDDLVHLAENMALNLILEKKSQDESIINSKLYKKRYEKEKNFLIINKYISDHIQPDKITEKMIKDFYNKHRKTLFTFVLEDGELYIQPIEEVKNFITDKLKNKLLQEAKYDLYRKIVKEDNLEINNELIENIRQYTLNL